MINFQMQPFSLYVNEPDVDKYGRNIEKWTYVTDILVALNFISINRMNDDIRYKDCDYSGLTKYKVFDEGKSYKIVSLLNNKQYKAESINTIARFTQLILKAVV